MTRSAAVVALLLTVAGAARADDYAFPTLRIARGYQGPLVIDVTWDGTTTRDVTTATATLRVYSVPPSASSTGSVLLTKTATPAGAPSSRLVSVLGQADTAVPAGSYYAELSISDGGVVDVLHGLVVVEGR